MRCGFASAFLLLPACMAGAQQALPPPRVNPFAAVTWQPPVLAVAAPTAPPPPALQPQSAPPAPPAPPPLPFRYLGRYSAGTPQVFLTKGDAMFLVKNGDTLEGGWRVDDIGGPQVQFTYLPLQMKQSLPTGDSY